MNTLVLEYVCIYLFRVYEQRNYISSLLAYCPAVVDKLQTSHLIRMPYIEMRATLTWQLCTPRKHNNDTLI
jgi:hypothetical protein